MPEKKRAPDEQRHDSIYDETVESKISFREHAFEILRRTGVYDLITPPPPENPALAQIDEWHDVKDHLRRATDVLLPKTVKSEEREALIAVVSQEIMEGKPFQIFPHPHYPDSTMIAFKELGKGGQGIARQCLCTNPPEDNFPLLTVKKELYRHASEEALKRFKREGKLHNQGFPGVPKLEGAGMHEGIPYLLIEYVAGQTFEKIIPLLHESPRTRKKTLAWFASDVIRRTAELLCHMNGAVHRDMKPSNLLAGERPPKLSILDMGLGKFSSTATLYDIDLTKPGQGFGTPAYMALEQATDAANVDPRTDIHALGAMGTEMMIGIVPYEESKDNIMNMITARIEGRPPEIDQIRSSFRLINGECKGHAIRIDVFLDRMLAKKKEDRPTPAEVVEYFRSIHQKFLLAAAQYRSIHAPDDQLLIRQPKKIGYPAYSPEDWVEQIQRYYYVKGSISRFFGGSETQKPKPNKLTKPMHPQARPKRRKTSPPEVSKEDDHLIARRAFVAGGVAAGVLALAGGGYVLRQRSRRKAAQARRKSEEEPVTKRPVDHPKDVPRPEEKKERDEPLTDQPEQKEKEHEVLGTRETVRFFFKEDQLVETVILFPHYMDWKKKIITLNKHQAANLYLHTRDRWKHVGSVFKLRRCELIGDTEHDPDEEILFPVLMANTPDGQTVIWYYVDGIGWGMEYGNGRDFYLEDEDRETTDTLKEVFNHVGNMEDLALEPKSELLIKMAEGIWKIEIENEKVLELPEGESIRDPLAEGLLEMKRHITDTRERHPEARPFKGPGGKPGMRFKEKIRRLLDRK